MLKPRLELFNQPQGPQQHPSRDRMAKKGRADLPPLRAQKQRHRLSQKSFDAVASYAPIDAKECGRSNQQSSSLNQAQGRLNATLMHCCKVSPPSELNSSLTQGVLENPPFTNKVLESECCRQPVNALWLKNHRPQGSSNGADSSVTSATNKSAISICLRNNNTIINSKKATPSNLKKNSTLDPSHRFLFNRGNYLLNNGLAAKTRQALPSVRKNLLQAIENDQLLKDQIQEFCNTKPDEFCELIIEFIRDIFIKQDSVPSRPLDTEQSLETQTNQTQSGLQQGRVPSQSAQVGNCETTKSKCSSSSYHQLEPQQATQDQQLPPRRRVPAVLALEQAPPQPASKYSRLRMNRLIQERVEIVLASCMEYNKQFIAKYRQHSNDYFLPQNLVERIGGAHIVDRIKRDLDAHLRDSPLYGSVLLNKEGYEKICQVLDAAL